MPNTRSAHKRLRQSRQKRVRNRAARSTLTTHVRRVQAAVETNDSGKATEEARVAAIKLDRAAARGVIHRNKAARIKSRLQRGLKALKQGGAAPASSGS